MRWSGATGAIARGKTTSIACARRRRSVRALHWIGGAKPKPKAVNKRSPHSIRHGLDKPSVYTTVSDFLLLPPRDAPQYPSLCALFVLTNLMNLLTVVPAELGWRSE